MARALGEEPAARLGRYPFESWERLGQWILDHDRFDQAGVTAHYACGPGRPPTLGAVTVDGLIGPQVEFEGIRLIGMPVRAVDTLLVQHLEQSGLGVTFGCGADPGPTGLNMYVRAARAGDSMVSEARFCRTEWEDHG
ncbi:hypothetical protein [Streptomyces hydrogenans]|uniref:hypothetical protein n=1 Tax=Streptomyces hydrogenans TaxID=1873719 RepID=UPI003810EEE5